MNIDSANRILRKLEIPEIHSFQEERRLAKAEGRYAQSVERRFIRQIDLFLPQARPLAHRLSPAQRREIAKLEGLAVWLLLMPPIGPDDAQGKDTRC